MVGFGSARLFMAMIALSCGLAGCAAPTYTKDSFPGWSWIGSNSKAESIYLDRTSVTSLGGHTLAWFILARKNGDYMKCYLEINCSTGHYKGLSATHFDESGNVKEIVAQQATWNYALIDTDYYLMVREACK